MDNLNIDAFYASLEVCLYCVGSGLVVGFILKFLVFGLSSIWSMFRHVAGDERG